MLAILEAQDESVSSSVEHAAIMTKIGIFPKARK